MVISMTSLRVIFTGRKKISILFLLLFISFSLYSSPYRIGVIADEGSTVPYIRSFSSILSFAASRLDSDVLTSLARENDEKIAERDYEIALSSAYRAERDSRSVSRKMPDDSQYVCEIVPLELSEEMMRFISTSDDVAIRYLKYVNDLDELYYIRQEEDDGLDFVSIYLDGQILFNFVYSEYVESSAEEEILLYMILRYRSGTYSLVHLQGNTIAAVRASGKMLERYGDYVAMPMGLNHITISSPTYESETIDFIADESFEILQYDLQKVRTMPLFISTIPYTDEVYYQGERVIGGYVEDTTYPFSIIASKEGFESRTVQSDIGEHSIEAVLLDSSLYYPGRLDEKKNEFYTHLLVTLLTYGASIATDVVADIYDLPLAPFSTLVQGVSILELVRTFTALFEYRDALSYGI